MKNIHVLPTDKPSRIVKGETTSRLLLHNIHGTSTDRNETQHIYITSDEEIKEGDWCVDDIGDVFKIEYLKYFKDFCKKIILTTDQDLIKDGVQAIDDEFLEWFVNNPSCEFVNIVPFDGYNAIKGSYFGYEIIIPKEEPKQESLVERMIPLQLKYNLDMMKQETLEEVAERYSLNELSKLGFINGAKWQQERSYSEGEVKEQLNLILAMKNSLLDTFTDDKGFITDKWFKQFKNK